ncbi:MAG TPA: c-type cytochrome [Acidimicrobiales bacterium]|nr:c-type cytochrome [Acidimicrobiales bacterium]
MNTQQKLGILVASLLVVGWLLYVAMHLRRPESAPVGSEIELAPNRKPYFDDDVLESTRLDKSLKWALVLLGISALGLPAYWLREPSRQAGADRGFDKRAVGRGEILFQPAESPIPAGNVGHFGCGRCHGTKGEGGVTEYSLADPSDPTKPPRQVKWAAPELNTVTLRYSDDQLRSVLVYGRPNTPMPPWGVLGGGPMNDQQIDDLIAYLHDIQLPEEQVKADAMKKYGLDGAKLFEAYCARCHTKGFSYGEPGERGAGAFGPSLTNGSTLNQFPDVESHVEFIKTGSQYAKPYGTRGVGGNEAGGMPGFGRMLTDEQIDAIVEYERSL